MNFDVSTDINNIAMVSSFDFHLGASSDAKSGAKADFAPKFATFTADGKVYDAPSPAVYFGAHGTK